MIPRPGRRTIPPPAKKLPPQIHLMVIKKTISQKNHGDADTMKKPMPAGTVFLIGVRHKVRQAGQSAPPCGGDDSAEMKLYTQNGLLTRGAHTY